MESENKDNDTLYRLYVDESGTHGYSEREEIGKRYLSLTGVIVASTDTIKILQPTITSMKRLLTADPDDLPALHREEIVRMSGKFKPLRDEVTRLRFNSLLLDMLSNMDYQVVTIVLDKAAHLRRYRDSAQHPYHYCLALLLERYAKFLHEMGGRGGGT